MNQIEIDRVTRIVRSHVPPNLDHEDIAIEVLIESWGNQIEHPSFEFIVNRCRNAYRSHVREKGHLVKMTPPRSEEDHSSEINDEVNTLVKLLDVIERKVIWYRFYQELSKEDIAKKVGRTVAEVRELLQTALFKMRSGVEEK